MRVVVVIQAKTLTLQPAYLTRSTQSWNGVLALQFVEYRPLRGFAYPADAFVTRSGGAMVPIEAPVFLLVWTNTTLAYFSWGQLFTFFVLTRVSILNGQIIEVYAV